MDPPNHASLVLFYYANVCACLDLTVLERKGVTREFMVSHIRSMISSKQGPAGILKWYVKFPCKHVEPGSHERGVCAAMSDKSSGVGHTEDGQRNEVRSRVRHECVVIYA